MAMWWPLQTIMTVAVMVLLMPRPVATVAMMTVVFIVWPLMVLTTKTADMVSVMFMINN